MGALAGGTLRGLWVGGGGDAPHGPMQGVGLEERMTLAEWPHEEWLLQATRRFPISECLVQRFK